MKALRRILVPFSWLFAVVVTVRNYFYDTGIFTITAIDTPVISVGNITTGGTGKTPLVEQIVSTLLGAGLRPAVLSRGYGRDGGATVVVSDGLTVKADADTAGDEPAQIARKFPGCAVVVDADRVRGGRFAESAFHPDVIVLDDGFQHRALRRDLDIVVLDASRGVAETCLLPAGNGREPLRSLRRADLVVLNAPPEKGDATVEGKPVVRMRYELKRFTAGDAGTEVGSDDLAARRFVAFSGIGNPGSFASTLERAGLKPESFLAYPDHHRYTRGDLDEIAGALLRTGAAYAVTTEKDAVRLASRSAPELPFRQSLVTAVIGAVITDGADLLERAVLGTAGRMAA
jgi:tetraacyldisaccharide 4'-kinase